MGKKSARASEGAICGLCEQLDFAMFALAARNAVDGKVSADHEGITNWAEEV